MKDKKLESFIKYIKNNKNWAHYDNGNYSVAINLNNGTKLRYNDLDSFNPSTIESCDVKITSKCCFYDFNGNLAPNCKMCYENSGPNGKHADILSSSWLDKLHPYCELAIGGGNPLEHPDLDEFLLKCKERKHLPSMTVNQEHFLANYNRIKELKDNNLIYGLGVSLTKPTDEFIKLVKTIPNTVIHTIAGLTTIDEYRKLAFKDLRILVLGYKQFRRGEILYRTIPEKIDNNINQLKRRLPTMIKDKWFNVVSFDNLSLKQLNIKSLMSKEEWDIFFQGDDGLEGKQTSATMFIDMVERNFAKNSCAVERYPLMDTAEDMYKFLKRVK